MEEENKRPMKMAMVNVRVLASEKAALKLDSSVAGLTVSEYVRRRALGRLLVSRADQAVLNELRRLGGLLKFSFSQGAPGKETSKAIHDLQRYIRRLSNDR